MPVPWMKIIPPNVSKVNGKVCSPWTAYLLRVTNVKSLLTKWSVSAILHLAKIFKEWLRSHYFGKCTFFFFEVCGKQNGENKTKQNPSSSTQAFGYPGFLCMKKEKKDGEHNCLNSRVLNERVAAHTWRITSQNVIFNIKILRPVGMNRMFYVNTYLLFLWDRGSKQFDFPLKEV